ncbi:hypothetical protein MMC16_004868 [Acarospora aff. strigata]|nr:hypothetical protein [Acarospora aff. strigata]
MAQNAPKKSSNSKPSKPSSSKSTTKNPKKGSRTIAPKNLRLIKQSKITKKHSSGLTARTEGKLAERVGHLELVGGGKVKGRGKDKRMEGKKGGKGG